MELIISEELFLAKRKKEKKNIITKHTSDMKLSSYFFYNSWDREIEPLTSKLIVEHCII